MPPTPRLVSRYDPSHVNAKTAENTVQTTSGNGPNAGSVAGGVTLTLVGLFILVVVIVPCLRRRQLKKAAAPGTSAIDRMVTRENRSFFGHRRTPPLAPILDRRGFGPEPEPAKPTSPLRQLRLQPQPDQYYENRANQSPAQQTSNSNAPRSARNMEERRRSMAKKDDYYGDAEKSGHSLPPLDETSPLTAYIDHLNSLAPPTAPSYTTGTSFGQRPQHLRSRTGGSVPGSGSSSSSLDSEYSQSSAESYSDHGHRLSAQHFGHQTPRSVPGQRSSFIEPRPQSPKEVGLLLQSRFRLASPSASPAALSPEEHSAPAKPRKRVRLPAPLELLPEVPDSAFAAGFPSPYLQSAAPRSARRRSALRYSAIPASALPYGHPHSGIPASALPYGHYPVSGAHSGIPPSALPYGYLHSGAPQSGFPHSGLHSGFHSGYPHSAAPHSGYPHGGYPHSGAPHSGYPHSGIPHSALPFSAVPYSAAPYGNAPHSALGPKSAAGFPLPASPLPSMSPLSPSDAVVVTPNPYQTSFDAPSPQAQS